MLSILILYLRNLSQNLHQTYANIDVIYLVIGVISFQFFYRIMPKIIRQDYLSPVHYKYHKINFWR
jgi:hypothetical protein